MHNMLLLLLLAWLLCCAADWGICATAVRMHAFRQPWASSSSSGSELLHGVTYSCH
jgi:hypothetical protein